MSKITLERIKQIIHEEMDHDGMKKVVNSAADLLKAILSFEEKATEKQKAGVADIIGQLKGSLETMVNGPGGYVDLTPQGPKKVVFSKPKVEDSGITG